jgi:PncC family amidohydrolase
MLTEPAGASDVYVGGWVTYANRFKVDFLEVASETIAEHGAVSGLTAHQMAVGALGASGASYALAITGIAGPGGGDENKPVGTVYIGLAFVDESGQATAHVRRFGFVGDRTMIRIRAAVSALAMLHFHLCHDGVMPEMTFGEGLPSSIDVAGKPAQT